MDVFRAREVQCARNIQIPSEVFVCAGILPANSPDSDVSMSETSIKYYFIL